MATLTKNCTYSSYNAFNPYGYGSAQSGFAWHGWGGSKVNNQYGFAGVRSSGSIRYAFAIRFKTPVFSGTSTNLVIKYHMNRETSAAATVNVTVTRFDPSTDTSSYTNTSLPSDPYSLGSAQQSCVSGDAEYTLTVPSTAILSNTTYYLVISPTPGTTNYATISDITFSAVLTYEAAASSVSATDGNLGVSNSVLITMDNDGLSHKLTYSFGNTTGTITNGTTASSMYWTPPASLMNQIPTAVSGTCTIYCQTDGGTTSCTCTLYVPDNIKPLFSSNSIAAVNTNATVASWGIYLQNFSKIRVRSTATAQYSTIVSWRIDAGAVSFSADNLSSSSVAIDETSDTLTASGTYAVTVTATDARGRSNTYTIAVSYTIQSYSDSSATDVQVYRCTSNGTRDDKNGTYLYAIATKVYSQVGSNSCTMQFQYKERSQPDSSYVSVTLTDNVGVIVGNGQIDVLKSYSARIHVQDSLTEAYVAVTISSQEVAFNMKPSSKSGVAFGMYAQDDEVVELAAAWKLRVNDATKILFQSQTLKAFLLQLIYPVGSYFDTSVNYGTSAAVNTALGLASGDATWSSETVASGYRWRRTT